MLAPPGIGARREPLVEERARGERPVRIACVVRNLTNLDPAEAPVEPLGVAARTRVEREQPAARGERGLLDGAHQRAADALPPRAAEHEQLLHVGEQLAKRAPSRIDLDGSERAGDEGRAFHVSGDATLERRAPRPIRVCSYGLGAARPEPTSPLTSAA